MIVLLLTCLSFSALNGLIVTTGGVNEGNLLGRFNSLLYPTDSLILLLEMS
jgi:hypothetical protein